MNNSCKIAAGRSPERFFRNYGFAGQAKISVYYAVFSSFSCTDASSSGRCRKSFNDPRNRAAAKKHHRPVRDLKFYDIIMIKRLNRIIIPTTIYMQVPKNGNGGIAIGQSKA